MSDTMIWIFGILLFLLLFFLASIWFLKEGMSSVFPRQGQASGLSRKDLAAVDASLSEIKERLSSIEHILQSVE